LSYNEVKKQIASFPPDNQVYELFRFWSYRHPPDVQTLFDQDSTKAAGYALYRKELERLGDSPAEIDRKIQVIDKGGERAGLDGSGPERVVAGATGLGYDGLRSCREGGGDR
jgi:hypothetical protein